MAKSHKGKFTPKHPHKYKGDPTKIVYRSSWELKLMFWLDEHKDVLEWASEEMFFSTRYRSPFKYEKYHTYFPDFWVKRKTKNGMIQIAVIEVKPKKQIDPPVKGKKKNKTFIKEKVIYAINQAKWESAERMCNKKGWKFLKMNEFDLQTIL